MCVLVFFQQFSFAAGGSVFVSPSYTMLKTRETKNIRYAGRDMHYFLSYEFMLVDDRTHFVS